MKSKDIPQIQDFCRWARENPKSMKEIVVQDVNYSNFRLGEHIVSRYFFRPHDIFTDKDLTQIGISARRLYL